ncbi:allophanate hydrolase subunit 1 [Algoriphagus aquatilis]|uniref:Allophanate hydrolase subunit 1 n=1 Tax=Algoriphagus aquatilis TaxID=490186 RepID=A0ABW0BTE0_9BACT
MKPRYLQLTPQIGELVWQQSPTDDLLAMQLAYIQLLEHHFGDKLIEFRQGFTRISLRWKEETDHRDFQKILSDLNPVPVVLPEKTWEIPVCYHESLAFDLEAFCKTKGLTLDQLMAIHTGSTYRIHFFGFLPGFFYLNGLPEILHSPRKATPSLSVPAGSVAIGGAQTGIYPCQSPGGWHCIGQTPIPLFDPKSKPPVWAKSGEQIQFRSITLEEFNNWSDANSFFKQP